MPAKIEIDGISTEQPVAKQQGVAVKRSETRLMTTKGGGMVAVARDSEEWGIPMVRSQEIGEESVSNVINVLAAAGRESWIESIKETEPFSPQDSAGMDLIVNFTPRFVLMAGVDSVTVEVKSSPQRMDHYQAVCSQKTNNGRVSNSREQMRQDAFRVMAEQKRVITNGQWANSTILGHFTAQLAEIARVATKEADMELYAGDFYGVLQCLGDREAALSYETAWIPLDRCGYTYENMYGTNMQSEAQIYEQYMAEKASGESREEEDCGGAVTVETVTHNVFTRQNGSNGTNGAGHNRNGHNGISKPAEAANGETVTDGGTGMIKRNVPWQSAQPARQAAMAETGVVSNRFVTMRPDEFGPASTRVGAGRGRGVSSGSSRNGNGQAGSNNGKDHGRKKSSNGNGRNGR